VLATLVAYVPALQGGYVWDDDDHLTRNRALDSADGLRRIWLEPGTTRQYYPLVHTSFWIETRLWGLAPFGFHLVNVVLHATSAVLLWRILARLRLPGAWLAAAIFALHPVHVESVAWISERKNVLSGVLYLAAARCYLRGATRAAAPPAAAVRREGVITLLLFAAALASKTVTASLPVALALVLWWKDVRLTARRAIPLLAMAALAVPAGLLTLWMERHSVGARGPAWDLSIVERGLIAGRALWFYAAKLAWPAELTFIYPRWRIDPGAAWHYLFPLAAAAVGAALFGLRRRVGRGPFVGVAFFALTLAPALGFFDLFPMKYSFVADHFQYLASVGLIALGTAAGARWLQRPGRVRGSRWTVALALALLALLGGLSWSRGRSFGSEELLWRDTIAKNSAAWMARISLGNLLERSGRGAEALAQYEAVLELDPRNGMALNNLGVLLYNAGRFDEAARYFERAFEVDPRDAMVQANLGDIRRVEGHLVEALEHYRLSLALQPDHAGNHYWMGVIHARRGDAESAARHLAAALEIRPDFPEARAALDRLRARN